MIASLTAIFGLSLLSMALSAWIKWRTAASAALFAVFIIPITYLAYTLIHGAAASVYPYPFFNVIKYGYASVLSLMGGVIVSGYVVALVYYGVERLRSRA